MQHKTCAYRTHQHQRRHEEGQHRAAHFAPFARGEKARQRDQQESGDRQWQRPAFRQARKPASQNIQIDGVAAAQGIQVGPAQRIGQPQKIVAVLLQAARIDIFAAVQRRVVMRGVADKGKIEACDACPQERRQVGVVGQYLVDLSIE